MERMNPQVHHGPGGDVLADSSTGTFFRKITEFLGIECTMLACLLIKLKTGQQHPPSPQKTQSLSQTGTDVPSPFFIREMSNGRHTRHAGRLWDGATGGGGGQ